MRFRPLARLTLTLGRNRSLALITLAFCYAAGVLITGFSQTFSVFLLPIANDLVLDRTAIASAGSVALLTSGLASPLAGDLFDRLGPLRVYLIGTLVTGLGFLIASQAESLWVLCLSVGFLVGIGLSLAGTTPAVALAARWFPTRMATATGVIFSASGTGAFLLAPASQFVIAHWGWRAAYEAFFVALALFIPLILAMPWKRIMGKSIDEPRLSTQTSREPEPPSISVAAAARTRPFWGLFGVYLFTAIAGGCITVHMVSFLVDAGFAPIAAATAFGMTGLLAPVGMIGAGFIADRLGRFRAVIISYSLQLTSLASFALLLHARSHLLLVPAVICYGLSSGSRGPIVSTLVMRLFGTTRLGGIYGTISLAGGLGGAVGALIGGVLQDLGGGDTLIAFASISAITGSAMFLLVPNFRRL